MCRVQMFPISGPSHWHTQDVWGPGAKIAERAPVKCDKRQNKSVSPAGSIHPGVNYECTHSCCTQNPDHSGLTQVFWAEEKRYWRTILVSDAGTELPGSMYSKHWSACTMWGATVNSETKNMASVTSFKTAWHVNYVLFLHMTSSHHSQQLFGRLLQPLFLWNSSRLLRPRLHHWTFN